VNRKVGFEFSEHPGIKCYAVASGSCWLSVQGVPEPVRITEGDCLLLPRGLPFCPATDLSLPRENFPCAVASRKLGEEVLYDETGGCSFIGGHFPVTGNNSEILLDSLPSTRSRYPAGCGFVRVFLNIFAVMPRTREAGTTAFIMRFRHPGIIKLNDDSAILSRLTSPRAPFAAR
jgi:Cupin